MLHYIPTYLIIPDSKYALIISHSKTAKHIHATNSAKVYQSIPTFNAAD